jgi:hypothetical protein
MGVSPPRRPRRWRDHVRLSGRPEGQPSSDQDGRFRPDGAHPSGAGVGPRAAPARLTRCEPRGVYIRHVLRGERCPSGTSPEPDARHSSAP